ncbi:TAF5-like RNA polymerase II p300/CBP-associated factor-associated factor 65 kDa subunit 5L [Lampetra fluviatilis]
MKRVRSEQLQSAVNQLLKRRHYTESELAQRQSFRGSQSAEEMAASMAAQLESGPMNAVSFGVYEPNPSHYDRQFNALRQFVNELRGEERVELQTLMSALSLALCVELALGGWRSAAEAFHGRHVGPVAHTHEQRLLAERLGAALSRQDVGSDTCVRTLTEHKLCVELGVVAHGRLMRHLLQGEHGLLLRAVSTHLRLDVRAQARSSAAGLELYSDGTGGSGGGGASARAGESAAAAGGLTADGDPEMNALPPDEVSLELLQDSIRRVREGPLNAATVCLYGFRDDSTPPGTTTTTTPAGSASGSGAGGTSGVAAAATSTTASSLGVGGNSSNSGVGGGAGGPVIANATSPQPGSSASSAAAAATASTTTTAGSATASATAPPPPSTSSSSSSSFSSSSSSSFVSATAGTASGGGGVCGGGGCGGAGMVGGGSGGPSVPAPPCAAEVAPGMGMLAAGYEDSRVMLWSLGPRKLRTARHNVDVARVNLACDILDDKVVEDSKGSDVKTLRAHSGPVYAVRFLPGGAGLLSCSEDTSVRFWDPRTFTNTAVYQGHAYPVWDVDVSALGLYFCSGSHDRTARLWVPERAFPLRVYAGHVSDVNVVRFHPNGSYVATGSADRTVRLWSTQQGSAARLFTGHRGTVLALAFSPGGRLLASGGEDQRVRLWDIGSGAIVKELRGHSDDITCLSFSPDGSALASGSSDGSVRVWDVRGASTNPGGGGGGSGTGGGGTGSGGGTGAAGGGGGAAFAADVDATEITGAAPSTRICTALNVQFMASNLLLVSAVTRDEPAGGT